MALHRTQVIGVNLSGANLTGASLSIANLSETRLLFATLNKVDSCQADLHRTILPDDNTESSEEILCFEEEHNLGIKSNSEERIYSWEGLRFQSDEEVKIAEALERAGVLSLPNSKMRLATPEDRKNQEFDFLIFHEGKWGILEVLHQEAAKDEERDNLFRASGIHIIEHYDANRCREQPDSVVQEFLETLRQA